MPPAHRRLSAILCADVVGYSRLMGGDEEGTLRRLNRLASDVIARAARRRRGRIVKTTGDGFLLEFDSAVNAAACALDIQHTIAAREKDVPASRSMRMRIGVHLADVLPVKGDVFGDGVNIAARLETLAEPGTVCISQAVYEQIRGKLEFNVEELGTQSVKNIQHPISAYRISPGAEYKATPHESRFWLIAACSVLLVATAIVAAKSWKGLERPSTAPVPERAQPAALSIAVLPFSNLSADSENDFFADSVTEDVVTDLSRISGAFVISSGTSFTYRGRRVDPRDVSRELNVNYIVVGGVRRSLDTMRVDASLVDGRTGAQIWGERFDRTRADMFSLQSEVTGQIARALNLKLKQAASQKTIRGAPSDLDAQDYALRGWAEIWAKPQSNQTNERGLEFIAKALERDPVNADAWATASYAYSRAYSYRWLVPPEETLAKALAAGEQAVKLDPSNADAFYAYAYAVRESGDLKAATRLNSQCIALNPNHAPAYAALGYLAISDGRLQDATLNIERALRLSPADPLRGVWYTWLSLAALVASDFPRSIDVAHQALSSNPELTKAEVFLGVALAKSGRQEEARKRLARVKARSPDILSAKVLLGVLQSPSASGAPYRERLRRYLKEAGIPD